MSKLAWDSPSDRVYETGLDRGVLYLKDQPGVAWNGLLSVIENSDLSESKNYLDGNKYRVTKADGGFYGQIEAFYYPEQFNARGRSSVGISYRTLIGDGKHYKIHLLYNLFSIETTRVHSTINSNVELAPFSWEIATVPLPIPGVKPVSHFVIDTRYVHPWVLEEVEIMLYGELGQLPRMPTPEELLDIFENGNVLRITDHGDGTFTAAVKEGYDDVITLVGEDLYQIEWPSVVFIGDETYRVSSL